MKQREKQNRIGFWISMALFLFCFILLFMQFQQVMVYYDDYGYYSLNYGMPVAHEGNTFSFSELLSFLGAHYQHANGRLLYFFVWLFLYWAGGLTLVRLGAAAILTGVLIALWSLLRKRYPRFQMGIAVMLCALYGLLDITLHRQGTYWMAAFFHYVTPLIPFLGFLGLYFSHRTALKQMRWYQIAGLYACVFCSAFSMESWSIATMGCLVLLILYESFQKNRSGILYGLCATGCLGVALLMLSPGIHGRAASSGFSFSNMSEHVNALVGQFFSMNHQGILTALFLGLTLLCVCLFWTYHQKKNQWAKWLTAAAGVAFFILSWCYFRGIAFWGREGALSLKQLLGGLLVLGLIFAVVSAFFWEKKDMQGWLVFTTGVLSIACLVVVPDLPARLFIPLYFVLFWVIVQGVCETALLLPNNLSYAAVVCSCLVFLVPAGANSLKIYRGYQQNALVHQANDEVLRNISQQRKDGENIDTVQLKKLPDVLYSCEMPYYPGFEYITFWMDHYYDMGGTLTYVYTD